VDPSDLLAERITALGARADGTARVAANGSRIEDPFDVLAGRDHVVALAARPSKFGQAARSGIDRAGQLGDANSADLFTEISREIDKQLWFDEAHLQA
jgi:starvation-inducible DNA-binding protein